MSKNSDKSLNNLSSKCYCQIKYHSKKYKHYTINIYDINNKECEKCKNIKKKINSPHVYKNHI